jgi:hypothetical protein
MLDAMPSYRCHKVVKAAEITVAYPSTGEIHIHYRDADGADKNFILKGKQELMARKAPRPGDFYVVYDNGYDAVSPRKEFLDGYDAEPGQAPER